MRARCIYARVCSRRFVFSPGLILQLFLYHRQPPPTPQHTSLHRALIPPPPFSIPIPLPLLLRGGCDLCYDASLNAAPRTEGRACRGSPGRGARRTKDRNPGAVLQVQRGGEGKYGLLEEEGAQSGGYGNNTHKPACEKLIGEVQASLGSFNSEISNLFCFVFSF